MSGRLDWAALMTLGLGRLGLRPREFWGLTPMELAVMAGVETGRLPMDRAGLAALAARFPDDGDGGDDGRA